MFTQLEAAGVNVVKIEVLPDDFLAWAESTGAGVDSNARAAYAALKAHQIELH